MNPFARISLLVQVVWVVGIYAAVIATWFLEGLISDTSLLGFRAAIVSLAVLVTPLLLIASRDPVDLVALRERRDKRSTRLRQRMQEKGTRAKPVSPFQVQREAARIDENLEEPLPLSGHSPSRRELERMARRRLRLERNAREQDVHTANEPDDPSRAEPLVVRSPWTRRFLGALCIVWFLSCGVGCVAAVGQDVRLLRVAGPFIMILAFVPGLMLIDTASRDRRTGSRGRRRIWRLKRRLEDSL